MTISREDIKRSIMIQTLKRVDYPNELIAMLLKSKSGAIVANIVAPIFIFYTLKDFVSLNILYPLTLAQFFIFIIRMLISYKIEHTITSADKKTTTKRLKYYLLMIFSNALLLGISGLLTIIYGHDQQVYMIIALIFALITGSISTLSPVYHAVFIYLSVILSIFIVGFIFLGNNTLYYFIALILAVYIAVSLSSSFRIYKAIADNLKQKKEISTLNISLEKIIMQRTQELVEKTKELESLNQSLDNRVKEESKKLRKNEQLLIQQSRQAAMGEMIGNIAHQWRQPLNALGLILQNIHFTYHLDDLTDDFMEQSTEKGNLLVQSMSKTIDDFRDFFKPNKQKEHFKISKIINQSVELVSAAYENNFIKIETNLNKESTLYGYPREFSQVILNILSNAKDALIANKIKDKKVIISSFEDDNTITITIADNAGGIPQEVIQKIFEPYFTTKEEGKGTGIGLYMSKTIIEDNMSGKLSVKSDKTGAIFTIIFPKLITT